METITLSPPINAEKLIKTTPQRSHYSTLIREDTRLIVDGKVIAIYVKLPKSACAEMRGIARNTKFTRTARLHGIPTQSTVYGSLPRTPMRVDFCRFSVSSKNERKFFETSFKFSEYIDELYKEHLPEARAFNQDAIESTVHPDWRVNNTPFTTCNFNVNHAIKYHRDSGNFKGVFSNVLILKSGITGGELVFPEFGVAFEQSDCALGIFDGQHWMHGVMPIERQKADSYRASIVFYALAGMKNCYPYKAELERFKSKRTERENQRAQGNPKLKEITGK
tara:strand:- start:41 stop:877 length:837 start_codon:yes stop_codon:yes gene_type:complete